MNWETEFKSRIWLKINIPPPFQDSVRVSSTFLAIIPLIQFVTSFLCSFATNKSNKVAGRHLTWVVGAVLGCLAALIIQFLPDPAMRSAGIFFVATIIGETQVILSERPHTNILFRLQQLHPPDHQPRPHGWSHRPPCPQRGTHLWPHVPHRQAE